MALRLDPRHGGRGPVEALIVIIVTRACVLDPRHGGRGPVEAPARASDTPAACNADPRHGGRGPVEAVSWRSSRALLRIDPRHGGRGPVEARLLPLERCAHGHAIPATEDGAPLKRGIPGADDHRIVPTIPVTEDGAPLKHDGPNWPTVQRTTIPVTEDGAPLKLQLRRVGHGC